MYTIIGRIEICKKNSGLYTIESKTLKFKEEKSQIIKILSAINKGSKKNN